MKLYSIDQMIRLQNHHLTSVILCSDEYGRVLSASLGQCYIEQYKVSSSPHHLAFSGYTYFVTFRISYYECVYFQIC